MLSQYRRAGHCGIESVAGRSCCRASSSPRWRSKKKIDTQPGLEDNLIESLQSRTAGDPDASDIIYTNQSPAEAADRMAALGTPVDRKTVKQWYRDIGLGHRQISKDIAGGQSPDRQTQFERIGDLIAKAQFEGNPCLSVDTKAKEFIGQLYRKGRTFGTEPFHAFDHDFPSWADGVVIPHGIYDLARNVGHINLGLSHDTSEFAVDSLSWYWNRIGKRCYPEATSLLLLCDCGGSNAANRYLFKHYLGCLARTIGLPIRVAHYPSYCSKYNPIERRFFPHVGRACSGMLFDCVDTVVNLMRQTSTRTGLRATVNVIERLYETGQKATDEMKSQLRITYDKILPKWNYTANP